MDGKCPECGRAVTEASEEAYFFKLSPFADRIEKLLLETDYLQPKSRAVELVNNFIKPGLEDLCVSRTSFTWGIPVTFDPGHVVYVWVDALSNYISALGYLNDKYDDFDRYWPADVHMVAKDIMRFHAIIWPAMLMALETGAVDFVCTDIPTAQGALAVYPDMVLLDFSGSEDNFVVSEEEINIGISVMKGNAVLKDALDAVLSTMTVDDFNAMMVEATAIQPING